MRVLLATIAALGALSAAPAMADLYPALQTANVTEGATDTQIKFVAVTPAYGEPLFPDVQFDTTKLTQNGPVAMSAPNTWRAAFKSVATLPGGVTTGTIIFRMCRDSPCTQPVAGTEQVFTYTINVALKDWVTFQRDAGHSGYVHASYAGIIKKRWVWQPTGIYRLYPVATKGSSIFLALVDSRGTSVASLSMMGAPQWVSPLPIAIYDSGPAISGDTVYVAPVSSSSMDNPIVGFDVNSGASATPTMTFDSQWTPVTAPTPFGDSLYIAAGYNGNEVLSFDLTTQARRWNSYGQGAWIWGGETPAVDDGHVYYYSGGYLDTFDRATGQRTASIADPTFDFGNTNGAAIHYFTGAPMLGTGGNVIVQDGTAGQAPLMKFTPAGDAIRLGSSVYWDSSAFANGVVYVTGYANGVAHLDAVNEADGALLWSWSPPADDPTAMMSTNIIVTDTLVFASTQTKLYAISATDPAHPVVWSAATPGNIAISRDNLLLVTTVLNGKASLVAYSVK